MVLLRFAPSPTGALHLGGLRTALYNYLYAKEMGGKWMMRIEDTDSLRTVPGSVDGIRNALAWAGLEYDYGPGKGGPHAPYFQSERLDLYQTYSRKLVESGHAYHCFCSADKLTEIREKLARSGSNLSYDKTCLHLTDEEVARKIRAGEKSVVRLNDSHLPSRPPATDIVFGPLKDAHRSIGTDPILLKSDMFPTYHLASVVDDHEMGITHVLRGEEWLPSLPLHLDLYASLSLTPPKFAHLPILLNPDGSKMSKRKGDVQVIDYMRRGWEPEAVLNWLALAGWGVRYGETEGLEMTSPSTSSKRIVQEAPDSTTIMTLPELTENFDLTALTHRSTSLDPEKLEYINKRHLMRQWSTTEGLQALAERAHSSVKEAFPLSQYTTVDYIKNAILVLQGRLTNIQDIPIYVPYLFLDPDLSTAEANKMRKGISDQDYNTTIQAVKSRLETEPASWVDTEISPVLHEETERVSLKTRIFMTVLRHALTGMKNGPSISEIMSVLGRERTLSRLQ